MTTEQRALIDELNTLLAELLRRRDGTDHANHEQYVARLFETAEQIHTAMRALCSSGYEVWATKNNGVVLKIGYLGERDGTRIEFRRFETSEEQTCELLVIVRFALGDERM
jgi:hypothetical protein